VRVIRSFPASWIERVPFHSNLSRTFSSRSCAPSWPNRFQLERRDRSISACSPLWAVYQRLLTAVGGEAHLLRGLQRLSADELRAAGLSPQKQRYLRDLAEKVTNGTVRIHAVNTMTNEEAVAELTQVIGIGKWTVQMLLIFSLGRLDVFPGDDLGIRTAIKKLYRKRLLPKPRQLAKFEKLWQPYATIASWYCWRSLEFEEN
jgi:DNA-3-methyladenine glycosylase II